MTTIYMENKVFTIGFKVENLERILDDLSERHEKLEERNQKLEELVKEQKILLNKHRRAQFSFNYSCYEDLQSAKKEFNEFRRSQSFTGSESSPKSNSEEFKSEEFRLSSSSKKSNSKRKAMILSKEEKANIEKEDYEQVIVGGSEEEKTGLEKGLGVIVDYPSESTVVKTGAEK